MSIQVQRRRGTTTDHSTFTGAAGELTVDTSKNTVVVHNGSTAGGFPLSRPDLAETFTNKTVSGNTNTITDIDLTAAVSGILPVANGGTGTTTAEGFLINFELDQVDNTADINKPVSLAQQTALDGKSNLGHGHSISDVTGLQTELDGKASTAALAAKQDTLVSSTNIKTVGGQALPGSGDVPLKTINGESVVGSGDIVISAASVPAGCVVHFAMPSAPTGWLKANGALVSRTTYDVLFASIGTTFGSGDGSTTFGLPDLRGEFVRGLDDGRGVDTGRALGSAQGHGIQSHSHAVSNTRGDSGTAGSFRPASTGASGLLSDWSTDSTGGAETRPRNVALLACIKF